MTNVHVVTPFFREKNKQSLIVALAREQVYWHPITDYPIDFGEQWIQPMVTQVLVGWHQGSWKTQWYIDHADIIDEDYYHVLCDDDLFEEGFYDKIRQCPEDVIVVSLNRGNRPSNSTGILHGCTTLVAAPQNMKRGHVSSQQYIIKGKIFKTLKIDPSGWADGLLGEFLYANYPIRYEPDWYAYFNYFDMGRWS